MKKTEQVTFLTNITVEHMTKIIASNRREYPIDPLFVPDPKIREQLLKSLEPFRRGK